MLEELQRLQAHIGVLKTRLAHYESENDALAEDKNSANEQHHSQIVQKNGIITKKQEEIDNLTEQLAESRSQFQKLNTDASALADRYSRLEKSCTDLKNRFQEILSERNELRIVKEKIQNEQRHAQQEVQNLEKERERLLQKNEHAKAKVEAIIQRLSVLGTAQDHHAQEIQQLAHPADVNEEV
jgi:chromosome segregation ATPase